MGKINDAIKIANMVVGALVGANESHIVREELKERGIWHRHHQYEKGDQYYQLGECLGHKKSGKPDADIAMQAANDFIQQWNRHQEWNGYDDYGDYNCLQLDDRRKVIGLDELMRNFYKKKESAAIQSLRTQLGGDIALTGTWDEAEDMRELEESELLDGEVSAYVCTVGSYLVRMAACLYQDRYWGGVSFRDRKPAGKDAIAAYRDGSLARLREGNYDFPYSICKTVSAKYIGGGSAPSEEWQSVCLAYQSRDFRRVPEQINFIYTLKSGKSSSCRCEELYVLTHWMALSDTGYYLSRFTPDGTVGQ